MGKTKQPYEVRRNHKSQLRATDHTLLSQYNTPAYKCETKHQIKILIMMSESYRQHSNESMHLRSTVKQHQTHDRF